MAALESPSVASFASVRKDVEVDIDIPASASDDAIRNAKRVAEALLLISSSIQRKHPQSAESIDPYGLFCAEADAVLKQRALYAANHEWSALVKSHACIGRLIVNYGAINPTHAVYAAQRLRHQEGILGALKCLPQNRACLGHTPADLDCSLHDLFAISVPMFATGDERPSRISITLPQELCKNVEAAKVQLHDCHFPQEIAVDVREDASMTLNDMRKAAILSGLLGAFLVTVEVPMYTTVLLSDWEVKESPLLEMPLTLSGPCIRNFRSVGILGGGGYDVPGKRVFEVFVHIPTVESKIELLISSDMWTDEAKMARLSIKVAPRDRLSEVDAVDMLAYLQVSVGQPSWVVWPYHWKRH